MSDKFVAQDIQKLKFPDNIRKRFNLYGGSNEDSTILFRELVDNGIDLVLKNRISLTVTAFTDRSYHIVRDNGPGMPLFKDKDYEDQSIIIDLLTSTHVGSNFKRTEYSCGLNGVGGKIPVATSDDYYMIVNAAKSHVEDLPPYLLSQFNESPDHKYFVVQFKKGIEQFNKITTKAELVSLLSGIKDVADRIEPLISDDLGTLVVFTPDTEILDSKKVKYTPYPFRLINRYFPTDSEFKDIDFNLILNGKEVDPFDFKGFYSDTEFLNEEVFDFSFDYSTSENRPIKFLGTFGFSADKMDYDSNGSVNLLRTPNGKHITIVQRAIGRALSKFNPLIKGPDSKYGLRLFALTFAVKPDYDSQTKVRLIKFYDEGYNERECINLMADYILENIIQPNEEFFNGYCNKIIEYKRSLDRLSKKDFIMSHIQYSSKDPTAAIGMGSRVYDCSSKKMEERELYITEGKSAGTSLLRVRDTRTQAVLPLRGVPLNAATSSMNKIVQNNEFKSLINVIGTGIEPFIRMDKKRYSKLIIASDADPAGKFICSLLLGFFGMYLRPWIEEGMLYVLVSPLYRQNGKYIFDDKELDKKKPFTRFKGLGELSKDDVKETLIDNRRLVRITTEDVDKALKLVINTNNERKALSQELGILVSQDEFRDVVDQTQKDILGSFDDLMSDDDDEESDSHENSDELELV